GPPPAGLRWRRDRVEGGGLSCSSPRSPSSATSRSSAGSIPSPPGPPKTRRRFRLSPRALRPYHFRHDAPWGVGGDSGAGGRERAESGSPARRGGSRARRVDRVPGDRRLVASPPAGGGGRP